MNTITRKINDSLEFEILQTYLSMSSMNNLQKRISETKDFNEMKKIIEHLYQNAEMSNDYKRTIDEQKKIDSIIDLINTIKLENKNDAIKKAINKLLKRTFNSILWSRFIKFELDTPGLSVLMNVPKVKVLAQVDKLRLQPSTFTINVEFSQLDDKLYAFGMSDNVDAMNQFNVYFDITSSNYINTNVSEFISNEIFNHNFNSTSIDELNVEIESYLTELFKSMNQNHQIWKEYVKDIDKMIDKTISDNKIENSFMREIKDINKFRISLDFNITKPIILNTVDNVGDEFEQSLLRVNTQIFSNYDLTKFNEYLKKNMKNRDKFSLLLKTYEKECLELQHKIQNYFEWDANKFSKSLKQNDNLTLKINEYLDRFNDIWNSKVMTNMHQRIIFDVMKEGDSYE